MAMSWVWGEKKKALKQLEVKTKNIPKPKKDTRLSIRVQLDVTHPEDMTSVAAILNSKMEFLAPEGVNFHSVNIMDVDVQS